MAAPPRPLEVDLDAIMALPAAQREEEIAKVELLRKVLEANPLWRYLPHEGEAEHRLAHGLKLTGQESRGQREFHELSAKGVVHGAAVAGNRFGKTTVNVVDAAIQTLPVELVPPWLGPYKRLDPERREVRVRFVGPDLPQWMAKVLLPKFRALIPAHALYKGEFDKAWADRTRTLRFADGSWWDVVTHDMPVDAYAGADFDRISHDEEPPGQHGKNCWEESIGRIIDREGDMRYTLTPLFGLSWLYYELTGSDGLPRKDDETWVVTGDIDHNPHLTEKGKRIAVSKWEKDPLKLQARRHGRWVHFEGLVYPEFHVKEHVVPDRDMPRTAEGTPAVPIVEMIDPGIHEEHAMAFVAFWMNPDGQAEVFHTHRIFGGTVADMADHIKDVRATWRYKPRRTKIDPSARNRNPQTGKSIQWAFAQQNIRTEPGNNQREAGINELKQRLKAGLIVFHASCSDLVDPMEGEFVKHRWKKPAGRTEDAPKPDVIKRDDDCLDALRYGLMDFPVMPSIDRDLHEPELDGPHQMLREHLRAAVKRRGRRGRVGGVFR